MIPTLVPLFYHCYKKMNFMRHDIDLGFKRATCHLEFGCFRNIIKNIETINSLLNPLVQCVRSIVRIIMN